MKVGVSLAGGGIRGIAHVGVLKALEEKNIKVAAIAGTSAGSIIATLYAMGYSPYYIYLLFKNWNFCRISCFFSVINFNSSHDTECCHCYPCCKN